MGGVDRTSISTNHLPYRWKVEMKSEESIKEEGGNEIKGGRKRRKNNIAFKNQTCNWT